jgi:plasmid stabilization system protein ParE
MGKKYELELLTPAQCELEEIGRVHLEIVGPLSARKITDRIYSALEKLKTFPDLGIACRDKNLAAAGYRMLICGNYLCFYRKTDNIVFVYHIVDGRTDYPKLLSDMETVKNMGDYLI